MTDSLEEIQQEAPESEAVQSQSPEPSDEASEPTLVVEGQVGLRSSMSMLFTDILSQELNSAISAPDTLNILQQHLRNKPLEEMNSGQLEPLMESIPDHVVEVVKEAVFCSGASVKRIDCLYPLKIGDRFIFRASGLMARLEILDGRVSSIRPLDKR